MACSHLSRCRASCRQGLEPRGLFSLRVPLGSGQAARDRDRCRRADAGSSWRRRYLSINPSMIFWRRCVSEGVGHGLVASSRSAAVARTSVPWALGGRARAGGLRKFTGPAGRPSRRPTRPGSRWLACPGASGGRYSSASRRSDRAIQRQLWCTRAPRLGAW
jgi:hypothetical protein